MLVTWNSSYEMNRTIVSASWKLSKPHKYTYQHTDVYLIHTQTVIWKWWCQVVCSPQCDNSTLGSHCCTTIEIQYIMLKWTCNKEQLATATFQLRAVSLRISARSDAELLCCFLLLKEYNTLIQIKTLFDVQFILSPSTHLFCFPSYKTFVSRNKQVVQDWASS